MVLVCVVLGDRAVGQTPTEIVPPAPITPAPAPPSVERKPVKKPAVAAPAGKREEKRTVSVAIPRATQRSTAPATVDTAYAAYQIGRYLTAFAEATRLVQERGDPKAMTLL